MTLLTSQRGSALLITLMATMLLTALGVALALTIGTETLISANFRTAQETLYAADAGIERSVHDLAQTSGWNAVLTGAATSSFVDGGGGTLPDGTRLNLAALTAALQAETDNNYGTNPNRPIWRLYAHAPMANLLSAGAITTRSYVIVWIADDPAETDADPASDGNDIVTLHAEAYGESGAHKVVEATVSRSDVRGGRLLSWREIR